MLGVCYYPERWPEDWWAADTRRMRELGVAYVRVGEFAWSHYEPSALSLPGGGSIGRWKPWAVRD